jgi:hypothetical protein
VFILHHWYNMFHHFNFFLHVSSFESRSTLLPYPPFSQVLLTDVCQVALKHFNGPDLTLKNSVTTVFFYSMVTDLPSSPSSLFQHDSTVVPPWRPTATPTLRCHMFLVFFFLSNSVTEYFGSEISFQFFWQKVSKSLQNNK